MNQAFNPVFAFKKLFGDKNANYVIGKLICHPIIWELFSTERFFLRVVDLIGSEFEKWTPKNICFGIDELIDIKSPSSNRESNHENSCIEEQILEINKSVNNISDLRRNLESWKSIFNKFALNEINENQIFRKWGTVFTIVTDKEQERKALEDALIENNPRKINLLSFLVHCTTDQNHIKDLLIRKIKSFKDNPSILRELVIKLDKIGDHNKAENLAKLFLNHPEIQKIEFGSDKSTFLPNNKNKELKNLNELRILSLFIKDQEKTQIFKSLAEELFAKSMNMNPVHSYGQELEIDDRDLISLDNYISIKKKQGNRAYSSERKNLNDIFQAFRISSSDETAARDICKRFINNSNKQGIETVLFSSEFGYLIDPIDIAKLFIKLRMERDAVLLLEQIIKSYPKNTNILRFLAHYCGKFGDHRRAVKYYSILFADKNISREEKIHFCKSLQYFRLWQDVLSLRKTINTLKINDKLEYATAAYRADNKVEFQNEIEEIISNSPNNITAQVLKALFLQGNNEKFLSDTLIAKVINEPNKDIRTIEFIEEYLKKNEDIEKPLLFLKGLPAKYQNHPEIKFLNAKAKRSFGKIQEYRDNLNRLSGVTGIVRQEVFEEILIELIENNMFDEAKIALETYEDKWVLSPKIAQAKAKVYVEEKKFEEAKYIISSLIADNMINEEIIITYGCLLLKTLPTEFPYAKQIKKLSLKEKNRFQELMSRLNNQKPSLLLRIMQIEIMGDGKESDYVKLLSDKTLNNSSESWRIPFSLGVLHYRKKKFDKAIVYLKEAVKIKPTHRVILDLLIQSYSSLGLPGEAIKFMKQLGIENHLSLKELIRYSDLLYKNHEFLSFIESAEGKNIYSHKFSIAKVKTLINSKKYKEADNCLSEIEVLSNLDTDYLLIIAQYYIDCGDIVSARRIIEKYLSNKEILHRKNILGSASIYYQLNDYKKAFHLVNQIKNPSVDIYIIKTDILIKQDEIELAEKAIDEAICLIGSMKISNNLFDDFIVSIPENWKQEVPDFYFSAILFEVKIGNLICAFDLAKKGILRFPSNSSLNDIALKISFIIGNRIFIDEHLKIYSVNYLNSNQDEVYIEAENALEKEENVSVAKMIADLNNENITNTHLEAIQARLLCRNGNKQEANAIYKLLLKQIQLNGLPDEVSSIEDINRLIHHLIICDTAYELDDLSTAMEISRNIISNFRLTYRIAKNYIKILASMLERNRINNKLMIKNHNFRILDDDLKTMEEIAKFEKSEFGGLKEWIDRSLAVLSKENAYHEEVIKLSPNDENIGAIIFSLISLGRKNEADRKLALMADSREALFTYAVLNIDIEPEKSKIIMVRILQKGDPKPEYYIALALINKNLGNLSDSYSAICLALDNWPEEYEWENIAGNLSKKMGNNLAAYKHFRNAEMYDSKNKYTTQILNISADSDNLQDVNILKKQLTNSEKDFPILIKIANTLVDKERLNEVIHFIEKARAIQPDNDEIKIIYAKIAFKKSNFEESQKLIDIFLNHNPSNYEAIKLKAMIIRELKDIDGAISFLDGFLKRDTGNEEVLIIQKAEFIKQKNGIDTAINYLIGKKELLENTKLLIYVAKLFNLKGDSTNALHFAEKALSKDSENSDLMYFLGGVSKNLGDLDKSIDYLFSSITIDPFDGNKYILLSQLFENRRDYKRAIDILMEGLGVLPEDFNLLRYTGILLYKQGKYKEANSVLEKAIGIDIVDPELEKIKQILDNSIQIEKNQISKAEV